MNGLSKTKLMLYLAAIFVAGGVTGAAIAVKTTKQMIEETPRPARFESRYFKEKFQSKLDLAPEQSKAIAPILDKMCEDLKSVRQDTTKRISAIMKTSYEQIGKELNPEQRKKLDAMQKERHEDRDRRDTQHRRFKPWSDSRRSNAPPQKS